MKKKDHVPVRPFTNGLRALIYGQEKNIINYSADEIAQDVEYVEVETGLRPLDKLGVDLAQADSEGCSGHECFFRRTGVRCSRCKNKD